MSGNLGIQVSFGILFHPNVSQLYWNISDVDQWLDSLSLERGDRMIKYESAKLPFFGYEENIEEPIKKVNYSKCVQQ